MGRAARVALLVLFLMTTSPSQVQAKEAGDEDEDLLITELHPFPDPEKGGTEYLALLGTATGSTVAGGWRVCDDRQCLVLPEGTTLVGNRPIYLAENRTRFEAWRPDCTVLDWEGRWPQMSNEGDYLWLEDHEGQVLDAVAFGRAYQGQGWDGPPGPRPVRDYTLVRDRVISADMVTFIDTNSADDWPLSKATRYELWYDTRWSMMEHITATPLTFPDMSRSLEGLIHQASTDLIINTYEITSAHITDVIAERSRQKVDVRVLLEGAPVGGLDDRELANIQVLMDAGCEVRISQGFRYDHAKFMVIDGERTIVMSENLVPSALWTTGEMGNRGWGIMIIGDMVAQALTGAFEDNWVKGLDAGEVLQEALDRIQDQEIGDDRDNGPEQVDQLKYVIQGDAEIRPLISPYNSEVELLGLIDEADSRIFIEMLSIDLEWVHLGERTLNPLLGAIVNAARRGVDVKVLLDQNFLETSENDEVVRYLNELALREGVDIEARLADILNVSMVHNKGMVIDDWVVVSSMNWVRSSFRDNYEVGLAISLEGLTDCYVRYFEGDWDPDHSTPGIGPVIRPSEGSDPSVYKVCGVLLVFGAIILMIQIVRIRKN